MKPLRLKTPPIVIGLASLLNSTGLLNAQTHNEVRGTDAGSITTGDRNSILGDYAATNLSVSSDNVVWGSYAGHLIENGGAFPTNRNVILGYRANGGYELSDWNAWLSDPVANPLPDFGGTTNTASGNVFIGYLAGLRNLSGDDNVFVGRYSGAFNTSASDNTFLGAWTGRNNTGDRNTFLGTNAGWDNRAGSDNTYVGEEAGYNNELGTLNVLVGDSAGIYSSASQLTAVGHSTLRTAGFGDGDSGFGCTAVGQASGYSNRSGLKNTFVGWGAGYDLLEGNFNTLLGAGAGSNTSYGDFNTFVGVSAGRENNRSNNATDANRNTYLGTSAGHNNEEGSDNVVIGAFADSATFATKDDATIISSYSNTSETNMGSFSFGGVDFSQVVNIGSFGRVSDENAIGIGFQVRATEDRAITIGSTAEGTHEGAITIGYGATSHADDTLVIGNDDTSGWHPAVDGAATLGNPAWRFTQIHGRGFTSLAPSTSSSEILFEADGGAFDDDRWTLSGADGGNFALSSHTTGSPVGILNLTNAGVLSVPGDLLVNSDARLKEEVIEINNPEATISQLTGRTYQWKKDLGRNPGKQLGFLAQEVETVIPELVSSDPETGIKSVNYQGLTPLLIEAVKRLRFENDQKRQRIAALKYQLNHQREMLEQLPSPTLQK